MSSKRLWVENCCSIDVAKAVDVHPSPVAPWYSPPDSPNPGWRARRFASFTITWEDGQPVGTVEVDITTTRLHFGGVRYWFMCPACRRRAKKLYSVAWEQGGRRLSQFGCRDCLALVYECQYRKAPRPHRLW